MTNTPPRQPRDPLPRTVTIEVADPKNPGKKRSVTLTEDQVLAIEAGLPTNRMPFGLPESPLFNDLDGAVLADIRRRGRQRSFSAGAIIYSQGEFADSVYLVISGRVRLVIKDSHGRNWAFFD